MAGGQIELAAVSQEKRVDFAALNAALHIGYRMLPGIENDMPKPADDAGILEVQHITAGSVDVEIRLLPEMAAGQCYLDLRGVNPAAARSAWPW